MKFLSRLRSLLRVSFATLLHEWLPSLCLMMALAAVLCPVVLILGLKHGTVENLRQSLLRDPANLEIRPRSSLPVDENLLKRIAKIEGVEFIVPKTRSLGSASVEFEKNGLKVDVDLLPTAEGDPLLITHRCSHPEFEEVVLTYAASKALSALPDDNVLMLLSRKSSDGISETQQLSLKVKGVLPQEATTIKAGYVQLPLLSAVEEYRENMAVPRLGWKGPLSQRATPVFDGFVLITEETIPPEIISRVSVATGFLSHRRIGEQESEPEFAELVRSKSTGILFYNENNPQPSDKIQAVSSIVGSGVRSLLPWVKAIHVKIADEGGDRKNYLLRTIMADRLEHYSQEAGKNPWIAVPKGEFSRKEAVIHGQSPVGMCSVPCVLVDGNPNSEEGSVYATADFTGIFRHLENRHLEWDPVEKDFLLGRRSYSSFRLYASGLNSVESVTQELSKMNIDYFSEAAKVARVMKFDNDLSILFWLVTAFSLTGGGAALALSLFGAIDRRKRDYAMLRMLGLPKTWLVVLPMTEALVIAASAFVIAISVYHINETVINSLFSNLSDDRPGFCSLPLQLQAAVLLCSLGLAICGALAASARLLTISPSKAIRN
jgi:putative ABC transport system permease protein